MPWKHLYCRLVAGAVVLTGLCFGGSDEPRIACHMEAAKAMSRFSPHQKEVLMKLNHVDAAHLMRLRRLLVPDRWDPEELRYSPMPYSVPELAGEKKAVIVDIPAQVFGAYEYGQLVRWGPVSTGDRNHQTPAGTYHLNWHAKVRISSEDPTWIMPWYFNFDSVEGLGLHEYSLPGRPASHGCARMLVMDAQWLFNWGDGWTIDQETRELVQAGTLVLLLGKYNYSAPPPWLRPEWWASGINLPAEEIESAASPRRHPADSQVPSPGAVK